MFDFIVKWFCVHKWECIRIDRWNNGSEHRKYICQRCLKQRNLKVGKTGE